MPRKARGFREVANVGDERRGGDLGPHNAAGGGPRYIHSDVDDLVPVLTVCIREVGGIMIVEARARRDERRNWLQDHRRKYGQTWNH